MCRGMGDAVQEIIPLYLGAWAGVPKEPAIFVFGLIVTVWPGSSTPSFLRAIGVAAIGMGLFGVMITVIAYRRGERWAWFTLWYYPIFWLAHLLGGLPPGQDHIHQIVFIVLSLVGLLIPVSEF